MHLFIFFDEEKKDLYISFKAYTLTMGLTLFLILLRKVSVTFSYHLSLPPSTCKMLSHLNWLFTSSHLSGVLRFLFILSSSFFECVFFSSSPHSSSSHNLHTRILHWKRALCLCLVSSYFLWIVYVPFIFGRTHNWCTPTINGQVRESNLSLT